MVVATHKRVAGYVATIREVRALNPATKVEVLIPDFEGNTAAIDAVLNAQPDVLNHNTETVPRLGDWPRDNLDLERWFRLPKGHERRIHGRCHAGVRIVQEGATMMLALDAHRHHPQPFTEAELRPYRDAEVPDSQKEVIHRRKVMRAARSTTKRSGLLRQLEERYAA